VSWMLAVASLVLWGFGITHFTIGGLVHVLLLAAIVAVFVCVLRGRRVV